MTVKSAAFWDMTPCSLVDGNKRFFVFRVEKSHFKKRVLSIGVTWGAAKEDKCPPHQYIFYPRFFFGGGY